MLEDFKRMKWLPLAVGAALCLLGLGAMLWPRKTAGALSVAVGIGTIVLGLAGLREGFVSRATPGLFGAPRMVLGGVNVAMGLVFICNRTVSLMFLAAVLGVVLILAGVLRLYEGMRRRAGALPRWQAFVFDGAVKCLVGAAMLLNPVRTMTVWSVLIGLFFVVTGISLIVSAVYLDKTFHDLDDL